ncbi:unnamed protein product, partial [Mesorhabditis belari]|uniref:RNA uridylyltransferase n=1 Tax=Mesorhabditis belari TaxID=2138241 RepID=A0AAF3EIK3_9BILA
MNDFLQAASSSEEEAHSTEEEKEKALLKKQVVGSLANDEAKENEVEETTEKTHGDDASIENEEEHHVKKPNENDEARPNEEEQSVIQEHYENELAERGAEALFVDEQPIFAKDDVVDLEIETTQEEHGLETDNKGYFAKNFGECKRSRPVRNNAQPQQADVQEPAKAVDSGTASTSQQTKPKEKKETEEIQYAPEDFPFGEMMGKRFPLKRTDTDQRDMKMTCYIEKTGRLGAITISVKTGLPEYKEHPACLAMLDNKTDEARVREVVAECRDAFIKFTQDLVESGRDHAFRTLAVPSTREFLAKHDIQFLEKPPLHPQNKHACYVCQVCKHHFSTTTSCREHLLGGEHENSVRRHRVRKQLLENLPELTQAHYDKMHEEIERMLAKRDDGADGSTLAHQARRIVSFVDDSIRYVADERETIGGMEATTLQTFRDHSKWSLDLYGSSLVGLDEWSPEDQDKDNSDINLHLSVPTITMRHFTWIDFFKEVNTAMEERATKCTLPVPKNAQYTKHKTFEFEMDQFKVIMHINCPERMLLSRAVAFWSTFRAGVIKFLRWIRKWALICDLIENIEKKQPGLPIYIVDLMSLHFLLQKGLLPNIFKDHGFTASETLIRPLPEFKNSDEVKAVAGKDGSLDWNLGQLFHDFLEYYVQERNALYIYVTDNKHVDSIILSNRRVTIVEPHGNIVSVSGQVFCHIFNVALHTFCYIKVANFGTTSSLVQLLMRAPIEKSRDNDQKTKKKNAGDAWSEKWGDKVKNGDDEPSEEQAAGIVWKYNLRELKEEGRLEKDDMADRVYSRRTLYLLLESEAVEEFSRQYRNELFNKHFEKLITTNDWAKYIRKIKFVEPGYEMQNEPENVIEADEEEAVEGTGWGCYNIDEQIDYHGTTLATAAGDASNLEALGMSRISDINMDATAKTNFVPKKVSVEDFAILFKDPESLGTIERNEEYDFEVRDNLTGGYTVERKCTACNSSDHINLNCPELERPIYVELPPPSDSVGEKVSVIINKMFDRDAVSEREAKKVESKVKELETNMNGSNIAKLGFGTVKLALFGSYCNRIGMKTSDVDICLIFADHSKAKPKVDTQTVMRKINGSLNYCHFTDNVQPVYRAKVPIVQFKLHLDAHFNKYKATNTPIVETKGKILDADVSYYNTLAMHNSRLLATYCELWPELRNLGVFVKAWAKDNFIGDAACGSISSYGHMLMLIHFLQQQEILPVLTEAPWLPKDYPRQECEGCDITFLEPADLHKAKQRMNWAPTSQRLGMIFLKYLDFYSNYDFNNQVIQIRTRRMVYIDEKREDSVIRAMTQWSLERHMYIEDPFERTHNLPSGVKERMMVYVMRCFAHSKEVLWTTKNLEQIVRSKSPKIKGPNPLKKQFAQARGNVPQEPEELEAPEKLLAHCRNLRGPPESRERCKQCFQPGHYAGNCPKKDDGFVPRQAKGFAKRRTGNYGNSNGAKSEANANETNVNVNQNDFNRGNESHNRSQPKQQEGDARMLPPTSASSNPRNSQPKQQSHQQIQKPSHNRPGLPALSLEASFKGPSQKKLISPPQKGDRGVLSVSKQVLLLKSEQGPSLNDRPQNLQQFGNATPNYNEQGHYRQRHEFNYTTIPLPTDDAQSSTGTPTKNKKKKRNKNKYRPTPPN